METDEYLVLADLLETQAQGISDHGVVHLLGKTVREAAIAIRGLHAAAHIHAGVAERFRVELGL